MTTYLINDQGGLQPSWFIIKFENNKCKTMLSSFGHQHQWISVPSIWVDNTMESFTCYNWKPISNEELFLILL